MSALRSGADIPHPRLNVRQVPEADNVRSVPLAGVGMCRWPLFDQTLLTLGEAVQHDSVANRVHYACPLWVDCVEKVGGPTRSNVFSVVGATF